MFLKARVLAYVVLLGGEKTENPWKTTDLRQMTTTLPHAGIQIRTPHAAVISAFYHSAIQAPCCLHVTKHRFYIKTPVSDNRSGIL